MILLIEHYVQKPFLIRTSDPADAIKICREQLRLIV